MGSDTPPMPPREDGAIRNARIDGIAIALDLRFGEAGAALLPEIRQIDDPERLARIMAGIGAAATPAEVRAIYAEQR